MKPLTLLIAATAPCGTSSAQWCTDQLSKERYLLTAASVDSTALFAGGFRQPGGVSDVAGRRWADMTLLVAEDTAQESTETATVTLTGATGAVLGTAPVFTLRILDDD